MMTLLNNVQNCGCKENLALTLRQNDLVKSRTIRQWRMYPRQEKSWWPYKKDETPRKGPDLIPKVKIHHHRPARTARDWSGEVAELDIVVQSKEPTSCEQANSGILKTMDGVKWKTLMPKQKVIGTQTRVGIG